MGKKRPDRAAKSSIRRKRALMLALVKYKARPSHEKYCRTKLPASSPNSSHSMQRYGVLILGTLGDDIDGLV